jgi:hypothetical protein
LVLALGASVGKAMPPNASSASASPLAQPPATWTDTKIPMAVEEAIDSLGRGRYASSYGGIAIINNQTQIAVYLTTPTTDIKSAFQVHAPVGMLSFRFTSHSLHQLDAIQQQLEGQWQDLIARGINVVEFGSNVSLGKEDIGVENLTAAQAQELETQFGADALHIYNVTPQEVGSRQLQCCTRTDDVAPYNGGDAISNESHTAGCTSGFGIQISGNPRLVTAGHCFAVGTDVRNAKLTSSGWTGSNNEMGSVTQRGLSSNLDSEVFTGCNGSGTCGGDGVIWTGAIGNPQRAFVSGKATWAVGNQMCASGAYGGELCDFVVQQVNYCTTIGGFFFCHLTRTSVTSGNYTQGGDSGGPWFRFSGSNLLIAGSHTGTDFSGHEWFTGVGGILSQWNACLITVGFGCVT